MTESVDLRRFQAAVRDNLPDEFPSQDRVRGRSFTNLDEVCGIGQEILQNYRKLDRNKPGIFRN